MKYTILTALFVAAGISVGSAATTITATNNIPGDAAAVNQVIDNAGNPLTGPTAQYQIGTFADPVGFTGFNAFGSAPLTGAGLFSGMLGAFGSPGVTGDLANASAPDDAFTGQPIFVVIEDPTGLLESIVWEGGVLFAKETDLDVGPAVGITVTAGNLLRGKLVPGGNTGLGGPLAGGNGGTAVTFIPEPSTSLLAGLAGLGLLIRRRR